MSVGSRIKEARERKEMSQVTLADKINVSKQTLYKYENDIITNVPSDKIEAISKALNVSPQYIMGWQEHPAATSKSPAEEELLRIFNRLNEDGKKDLLKYARMSETSGMYIGEGSDQSGDGDIFDDKESEDGIA